jgi:Transposase DDE domain group 1
MRQLAGVRGTVAQRTRERRWRGGGAGALPHSRGARALYGRGKALILRSLFAPRFTRSRQNPEMFGIVPTHFYWLFVFSASLFRGQRRIVAKAEWTKDEANPRFVVTSLTRAECKARYLYEKVYCARGDMENRIKECQLDLYADRTSTATMRENQLRLWFASMAYVLLCALRRIALHHTPFAKATCLKLLKIGVLVRVSGRRIKVAMASACPAARGVSARASTCEIGQP